MRREALKTLCGLLQLSGADNKTVLRALDDIGFKDFEDALQDCCANVSGADYIVTENLSDFAGHSIIPAVMPDELLGMIE